MVRYSINAWVPPAPSGYLPLAGDDPHQHLLPDPVRRVERQLRECILHDRDVVGGGVGAGVAGPQQHRDGFTGAAVAVVDERAQRMET